MSISARLEPRRVARRVIGEVVGLAPQTRAALLCQLVLAIIAVARATAVRRYGGRRRGDNELVSNRSQHGLRDAAAR